MLELLMLLSPLERNGAAMELVASCGSLSQAMTWSSFIRQMTSWLIDSPRGGSLFMMTIITTWAAFLPNTWQTRDAQYTMEQHRIQSRLMYLGVSLYPQHILESIRADSVTISNTVSGVGTDFPCDAVLLVTDRLPNDALYQALKPALNEKKLSSLRLIGDAQAPDIIAQATFSGYLAAAEFDETIPDGTPFKVEYIEA